MDLICYYNNKRKFPYFIQEQNTNIKTKELLWKASYTAFGIPQVATTDKLEGVFEFHGMFSGCQFDEETSLSYHWNRWRNEAGNSFISEDPIRDGSNWYGYAGQNPINFVDPNGLEVETIISQYHMTNYDIEIPNSNGANVSSSGCAITLDANVSYSVGNTGITPETIAQNPSNFDSSGRLNWNSPLPNGVTAERVDAPLTVAEFNNYQNSENHYHIGIQVQYTGSSETPSSSSHWVGANGIYTDVSGNDFFIISATSNYDSSMGTNPNGNNRGGLGWQNIEGIGTVVPVNRVTGYVVYSN